METNYYRTYEKISCNIYGWRFSIAGLIHVDINAKKRVLLQTHFLVFSMISIYSESSGYNAMISYAVGYISQHLM